MTTADMLSMLKIDLGLTKDVYNDRLSQLLEVAQTEIERETCEVSLDSVADCNLVVNYAAWLWRKRDTGEGMPRMIRRQMNNRIFERKDG